jgi:ABC-type branched-subunit amino acid transport system ATPase component
MSESETLTIESKTLSISNVVKSFGGIRAIRDVSFEVPAGKVTCLVGPNGAGKTTLFNLITGVLRPDSGAISYGGTDLTTRRTAQIVRLGLARSFQGVRLFESLTALENIEVGIAGVAGRTLGGSLLWPRWFVARRRSLLPEAEGILERLSLQRHARTVAADLSLAEKKLLAVGRLLATKANMLLLDEPLAGLDEGNSAGILDVLHGLAADGRGVLLIEHNFDVVRALSDRAVFLSEGGVVFIGRPDEITAQDDLSRLYFGESRAS